MADNYVSWVREALAQQFPKTDLHQGVDLNQDGQIEENEKIKDFNQDGFLGDEGDWHQFYGKNQSSLQKLGGFFSLASKFKGDNPIHDLLWIESKMPGLSDRLPETYRRLEVLLNRVKGRLAKENGASVKIKLAIVYEIIKGMYFFPEKPRDSLFISNLLGIEIDNDTSNLVVKFVSHEMGWPVYLVSSPAGTWARWDDGKWTQFYISQAGIIPEPFSVADSSIDGVSISAGVYLANLNRTDMLALFFANRGSVKQKSGNNIEAIEDFDNAVAFNPLFVLAYLKRGSAKNDLGKHAEAIEDYNIAIRLDPRRFELYNNRGNAKSDLGKYAEAIGDYNKAIKLNPKGSVIYYNRGNAERKLGRQAEAIWDYNKAIELDPKYAEAYVNRGNAQNGFGKHAEAIEDYNKAIKLDPGFAEAYFARGNAKSDLRKHVEAIEAYNKAIELNPKYVNAYINRGHSRNELGNHAEAIEDFNKAIELDPMNVTARRIRDVTLKKLKTQVKP